MLDGSVARYASTGWLGVSDQGVPQDPRDRPEGRSPHSPEPVPAFGLMLHLLGAVALGFGALVWGALLLFGAVEASWLRTSFAVAGVLLAVAWVVWLFRVTIDREVGDDEPFRRPPDGHGDGAGPDGGVGD